MVQRRAILTTADQQKVIYDLSNGTIFNDLERPGFMVTQFFDAEYLRNGTRYRQFQWNTNTDLHAPYSDTKRGAVSLRQLSFLFFSMWYVSIC